MLVGVVIPAWRRPEVTGLCLRGLDWLAGRVALSGITLRPVVVADDDNLDVAGWFGVDTIEADNRLGRRVNLGFRYWAREGADWLMFCGSDNWLHPDVFSYMHEDRRARAGRFLTVVDMDRQRYRCLPVNTTGGAAPWLIPTDALAGCDYMPVPDDKTRGMEFWVRNAADCEWRCDQLRYGRVDFKSAVNITPYRALAGDLPRENDPWEFLNRWYPHELVAAAWETATTLDPVAA